MTERQPIRMQCLPRKLNRTQRLGPISIPRLANERMPVEASLQPDLIAAPSDQPHLDQGRTTQRLNHSILTSRFLTLRIPRMRLFLDQRFVIPYEMVMPRARR